MTIREAKPIDEDKIRGVHRAAFGDDEDIAGLAGELLHEAEFFGILHLVACEDEEPVGHIAFSPVKSCAGGKDYLLAPLGVVPSHQKAGIGSKLVEEGIRMLKDRGAGFVLVYGDPDFYGRFGFEEDLAKLFQPEFKLSHPFGWQALNPGGGIPPGEPIGIECVAPLNKPHYW